MNYTIKQKMSGTGSIHDISSDKCDRQIKFRKGCDYAVVLASYYGGKGYTTHKDLIGVERQMHKVKDYSFVVIDNFGNKIDIF